MSSTEYVYFGPIGIPRWPPRPLIGLDIFNFSTETTEENSRKLDRKQDLDVLYQVWIFWADWETKMAALASNWLRHFGSPLKPLNRIQGNFRASKISKSYSKFVFFGPILENQDGCPGLIGWDIFNFSSETEFKETWQEAWSKRPFPSLCFSGWSEIKPRWLSWPIRQQRWHIVIRCTICGPLAPLLMKLA